MEMKLGEEGLLYNDINYNPSKENAGSGDPSCSETDNTPTKGGIMWRYMWTVCTSRLSHNDVYYTPAKLTDDVKVSVGSDEEKAPLYSNHSGTTLTKKQVRDQT